MAQIYRIIRIGGRLIGKKCQRAYRQEAGARRGADRPAGAASLMINHSIQY